MALCWRLPCSLYPGIQSVSRPMMSFSPFFAFLASNRIGATTLSSNLKSSFSLATAPDLAFRLPSVPSARVGCEDVCLTQYSSHSIKAGSVDDSFNKNSKKVFTLFSCGGQIGQLSDGFSLLIKLCFLLPLQIVLKEETFRLPKLPFIGPLL